MKRHAITKTVFAAALSAVLSLATLSQAHQPQKGPSSYAPVVITEAFASVLIRMRAAKVVG